MTDPVVSVVTVTWNNVAIVDDFLASIFRQENLPPVEVIVVDNGSRDGTVDRLAAREDVTLIASDLNGGYGFASNLGIQRARGRYVLLCNPDVIFEPGSIGEMVAALEARPDLGAVGPVILTPGDPPAPYPLLTTDPGIAYGFCFFSGLMHKFPESRWVNGRLHRPSDETTPREMPWLHGCCWMVRREALDQVHGYDPCFFLYFEDCDIGRRVREAGWKQKLIPGARIVHLEEQSSRQMPVRSRVHFMESWHKYQRKHAAVGARAMAWFAVLAGLGLQAGAQVLKALRRRQHTLPGVLAWLRVHLSAPWRDLAAERARELREQHDQAASARPQVAVSPKADLVSFR